MKTNTGRTLAALLALSAMGRPLAARAADAQAMPASKETKQAALRASMRKLWAEHVIWTRAYVVAALAGSSETPDVAVRLLRNQADIGDEFTPYYGKEAGAKLTALLKEHILIAADVVQTAKAGDGKKHKEADVRWHENAEDIAVFLSGLNPAWAKKDMLGMLNDHLELTTKEAMSRLSQKWPDDIAAFDEILGQMMTMADDLTDGIVAQHPEKF